MNRAIKFTTLAAIILTISAGYAQAQIENQLRAEIPFDFSAGKSEMKAGTYMVGIANPSSSLPVMTLTNRETGRSRLIAIVQRAGYDSSEDSKLTFVRIGDHYSLAAVAAPSFGVRFKKTWTEVRDLDSAKNRSEVRIVKLAKD